MPPGPEPVRFVVLGDAGEGNAAQSAIGARMATVCASLGCDFALYLGDNFYSTGVSSLEDMQFQTKFEIPYEPVDFPFYVVLGNHDYGSDGLGLEWWKGPIEIAYSSVNPQWVMPSAYYTFDEGNASFFAFDTNAIMHSRTSEEQAAFFETESGNGTQPWRIGFGHHPYRSNGSHGNAGNYEGLPSFIPIAPGQAVRDFFEDSLCGELDVFFAGHDHNRQWLSVECGMLHIVSGAGAKTTGLEFRDENDYEYSDDTEPGFMWVEIVGDTLRGRFYDAEGNVDFEQTLVRPSYGNR